MPEQKAILAIRQEKGIEHNGELILECDSGAKACAERLREEIVEQMQTSLQDRKEPLLLVVRSKDGESATIGVTAPWSIVRGVINDHSFPQL